MLICHFSYEFLTTKYIQEHLNEIYNYVKQASKIPSNLNSNKIRNIDFIKFIDSIKLEDLNSDVTKSLTHIHFCKLSRYLRR